MRNNLDKAGDVILLQYLTHKMKILFNKTFLKHNPVSEAEGAYRIGDFTDIEDTVVNGEEYISLVHSDEYIIRIREGCDRSGILAEVFVSPDTYKAACLAVGATILASEQSDFAVVRPPGHHSRKDREAGFCFFNNIAIATQKLVNQGKKVFILDIDGHHGDGTQSIFYDSGKVLFCSIHQQYAYPFSGESHEQGAGDGAGLTMNFPLPSGSGDKELLECVDTAIKKAKEFGADIVGVSAGFDGYEKDRLLGLNYTLNGYYEVGNRLSKSFTNIFAVLEGGYHSDIRKCVESLMEGVNKESRQ